MLFLRALLVIFVRMCHEANEAIEMSEIENRLLKKCSQELKKLFPSSVSILRKVGPYNGPLPAQKKDRKFSAKSGFTHCRIRIRDFDRRSADQNNKQELKDFEKKGI